MVHTGKSRKEDTCMYELMIISLVKGERGCRYICMFVCVYLYIHIDLWTNHGDVCDRWLGHLVRFPAMFYLDFSFRMIGNKKIAQ